MDTKQRIELINQLDRSFMMMPLWAKRETKQLLGVPLNNPATGKPFQTFAEVLKSGSDETLEKLRNYFDEHGDLLPPVSKKIT